MTLLIAYVIVVSYGLITIKEFDEKEIGTQDQHIVYTSDIPEGE